MSTRYAGPIANAITELSQAIFIAELEIPHALRSLHWQKAKGNPLAWEAVALHAKADGALPEVLAALSALKMATECREGLKGVLNEVDGLGKIPDLSVGKMRRE